MRPASWCSFPGSPRGILNGSAACRDCLDALFLQRGLGGGEAGDRHAVRRAADVVEPQAVAERHRVRLAAVLAADAELEVVLDRAAPLDRDPHQVADTALVEGLERVALKHPVLEVAGEEL